MVFITGFGFYLLLEAASLSLRDKILKQKEFSFMRFKFLTLPEIHETLNRFS